MSSCLVASFWWGWSRRSFVSLQNSAIAPSTGSFTESHSPPTWTAVESVSGKQSSHFQFIRVGLLTFVTASLDTELRHHGLYFLAQSAHFKLSWAWGLEWLLRGRLAHQVTNQNTLQVRR